jgi:hypothetical protein
MRLLTALLVVAALHPRASFAADCDPSESGTVSVDGTVYPTIQDAVDAAPAGATVRICDGTYFENIVVDSDVVLEGAGADLTILDGSEDGSVVRVDGADVDLTLRGLTLQHGTADAGGGIFFGPDAGSMTLSGTVIRDNTAGSVGGGVYFRGSVAADDDTVITGNVANEGGGVYGGSTWYGGRIENNDAVYTGGGVYLDANEGEFRNVAIVGNHSDEWAGGIFLTNGCTLRDSSVTDNTVDGDGGGLQAFNYGGYSVGNGVTVRNSVVTGNLATGHGGGAYVETRFNSIDTDWGEGEFDNGPDDVYFDFDDDEDPVAYTGFGGGADFKCLRHEGVCE